LALEHLALGTHRYLLAGRHHERTGEQSGNAASEQAVGAHTSSCDPEDEARIRPQSIVDAENGGA
jgi:hypothetical protein